jgi:hypothetical protein
MRLLRDRDGDIPVEARHAVFRYSPARATLLAGAGVVATLTLVWAGWSRGVNLRRL